MDTVPELLLALLDALELAVELDGLFSSFMPEELAALLAAEDADCELLDAAGWELLAGAELAAVLDEDAADELLVLLEPLAVLELLILLEVELLAKLLPALDGNSGASGIPAQEVRIMADITAAAAAPHTARRIGIFSFIWMHFLLHKYPLGKTPVLFGFSLLLPAWVCQRGKAAMGHPLSPQFSFPVTALQNPPGMLDKGRRSL